MTPPEGDPDLTTNGPYGAGYPKLSDIPSLAHTKPVKTVFLGDYAFEVRNAVQAHHWITGFDVPPPPEPKRWYRIFPRRVQAAFLALGLKYRKQTHART